VGNFGSDIVVILSAFTSPVCFASPVRHYILFHNHALHPSFLTRSPFSHNAPPHWYTTCFLCDPTTRHIPSMPIAGKAGGAAAAAAVQAAPAKKAKTTATAGNNIPVDKGFTELGNSVCNSTLHIAAGYSLHIAAGYSLLALQKRGREGLFRGARCVNRRGWLQKRKKL
jgi:hypothetical protein